MGRGMRSKRVMSEPTPSGAIRVRALAHVNLLIQQCALAPCSAAGEEVPNPGFHLKGPWTVPEDDRLIQLVNQYGPKKWKGA